jgi:hypothetical protein
VFVEEGDDTALILIGEVFQAFGVTSVYFPYLVRRLDLLNPDPVEFAFFGNSTGGDKEYGCGEFSNLALD